MRVWVALMAVVTLALAPSLTGRFVWDDTNVFIESPHIANASTIVEVFRQPAMWIVGMDDLNSWTYRPLALATFALEYQLWGPWAPGFHLGNLLLHLAVVSGVFALFRRHWSTPAAAAAALWCGVHASTTESIAWINGRSEPLALLFGLVGLLSATARAPSPLGLAGVALGAAGAVLGKESGVAFAFLLPLFAWAWHPPDAPRRMAHALAVAGATAAGLGLYAGLRAMAVTDAGGSPESLVSADTLRLIAPFLGRTALTALYPTQVGIVSASLELRGTPPAILALWSALAAALVGTGLWAVWRRHWTLALGLLWWGLSLAPCALLVGSDWPGLNRWLYIGMPGLCLAAGEAWRLRAAGVNSLATVASAQPSSADPPVQTGTSASGAPKDSRLGLWGFVLAGLLAANVVQLQRGIGCWSDNIRLFVCSAEENDQHAYAWAGLGQNLAEVGQYADAVVSLERAQTLGVDTFVLHWTLAASHAALGQCDRARMHLTLGQARRPAWQNPRIVEAVQACSGP